MAKNYAVKTAVRVEKVNADYYIIEHGGTLSFRRDGETILSFNHRDWVKVSEVLNG